MAKFSANLGFLWRELPLPDAIRATAAAGFAAVECHIPYDQDLDAVIAALAETGLPMLSINTRRGGRPDDFGLAALPGGEAEARAAIEEAVACAARIGARNVHVTAGKTEAPGARETYLANLAFARDLAAPRGVGVLIEPINRRDVPGFFLRDAEHAAEIIAALGGGGVKIMFDCYHAQIMRGDLIRRLEAHLPLIGHVQIAAVPSRAEPDEGEVAYDRVMAALDAMGYAGYVGAEYNPRGSVMEGLGWLRAMG